MDDDPYNDVRTKLLTLLNVSHLRSTKRKLKEAAAQDLQRDTESTIGAGGHGSGVAFVLDGMLTDGRPEERVKLNRRTVKVIPVAAAAASVLPPDREDDEVTDRAGYRGDETEDENVPDGNELVAGNETETEFDHFADHFGPDPTLLSAESRSRVDAKLWRRSTRVPVIEVPQGASFVKFVVDDEKDSSPQTSLQGSARLSANLKNFCASSSQALSSKQMVLRDRMLDMIMSGADVYFPRFLSSDHDMIRQTANVVLLDHISKIRLKVLKNNDRVASANQKKEEPPEDVLDQGFTRPSILVLVPFRNSALAFLESLFDVFISSLSSSTKKKSTIAEAIDKSVQVHHLARFISQYSLPEGSVDKLQTAPAGTYQEDHVRTFSGNVDDNFRIGVKVTKKALRLYEKFYGADLIVASPLGLRMICEKEGHSDFLSSIERVVVDQMDVMLMQNWEHVQFVFGKLNQIPQDSHDADFSRIKPWFLEGQASFVRQSILLSQYETPETRALFNSLQNVAGKYRAVSRWESVQVIEGVEQKFTEVQATNPRDEADRRFEFFTTKLFPKVLRSAVRSSGTLIFVPSYFDFVRVQNWMWKNDVSCAFLSEYSSNQDISRARQAFFSGKKTFLVMTERFYFFRRYRLRGVRNILFYAPPDHAHFYAELIAFPFASDENEGQTEPGDVDVELLYTKFDFMRLERIVGTEKVKSLVQV